MDASSAQATPDFSKYYTSIQDATILVINQQGIILFCNEFGLNMLEYSGIKEQLIGQVYTILIEPSKHKLHDAHVKHYFKNVLGGVICPFSLKMNSRVTREIFVQSASGQVIPCHVTACSTLDLGEGYIVITIHDLRVEKSLEQQRTRLYEEMSSALQKASHELRTAVHGIYGGNALLSDFLEANAREEKKPLQTLDRQQRSDLLGIHEMLEQSASHLYNVSNAYLGGSKEKLAFELQTEPFSIAVILDQIYLILLGQQQQTNPHVSLKIDYTALKNPKACVQGNVRALKQILLNLGGNALKFTKKGEVTIAITEEKPYSKESDLIYYRLTVSDTGPGLTEEQKSRMWLPKSGLRTQNHTQIKSSGIGLFITKQLIEEKFQGKVSVDSVLGKGTDIHLSFSLLKESPKVETPFPVSLLLPSPERKKPQKIRVLAAEDVPINQKILQSYFKKKNSLYSLTLVQDGLEAVDALKKQDFDVILMDYQMPNLDGLEAAKQIRALPDLDKRDIPIIFCSANEFDFSCISGQVSIIHKPYNAKDIFEKIHELYQEKACSLPFLLPSPVGYLPLLDSLSAAAAADDDLSMEVKALKLR